MAHSVFRKLGIKSNRSTEQHKTTAVCKGHRLWSLWGMAWISMYIIRRMECWDGWRSSFSNYISHRNIVIQCPSIWGSYPAWDRLKSYPGTRLCARFYTSDRKYAFSLRAYRTCHVTQHRCINTELVEIRWDVLTATRNGPKIRLQQDAKKCQSSKNARPLGLRHYTLAETSVTNY